MKRQTYREGGPRIFSEAGEKYTQAPCLRIHDMAARDYTGNPSISWCQVHSIVKSLGTGICQGYRHSSGVSFYFSLRVGSLRFPG